MVYDSRDGLWQARSAAHTLSARTFCINSGADFARMDNTFSEQLSSLVDDPNDVSSTTQRAGGPARQSKARRPARGAVSGRGDHDRGERCCHKPGVDVVGTQRQLPAALGGPV